MRKESKASIHRRREKRERPLQERDISRCGGKRGLVEGLEHFALLGKDGMTQGMLLQSLSMQHTRIGEEGTLNTLDLIYKTFFFNI